MKQIINGKLYDTATATLVGTYNRPGNGLYRTKNGNYFMDIYDGVSGDGGRYIRPVSKEEAQEWAGKNDILSPADFAKEFGITVEEA